MLGHTGKAVVNCQLLTSMELPEASSTFNRQLSITPLRPHSAPPLPSVADPHHFPKYPSED